MFLMKVPYRSFSKMLIQGRKSLLHPKLQSYVDNIMSSCEDSNNHKLFPVASNILKLQNEFYEVLHFSKENDGDKDLKELADGDLKKLESEIDQLTHELLEKIIEKDSSLSAASGVEEVMLEITAGVGGQEAMLFASDLYNLYFNYSQHYKRWDVNPLQEDRTELGGLRHGAMLIKSPEAYTSLIFEAGTHRVQRIPKTEKSGRIHTSTSSVSVLPTPSKVNAAKIPNSDLRIETKRASGAGGQHVNTTESAVRITHLPTGIQIDCQTERSQIRNRANAMTMLVAKLYQMEVTKANCLNKSLKKSQVLNSDRSDKIRTYNYLQDRITDHRLGISFFNLKNILMGGIEFDAFLQDLKRKEKEKLINEFYNS